MVVVLRCGGVWGALGCGCGWRLISCAHEERDSGMKKKKKTSLTGQRENKIKY